MFEDYQLRMILEYNELLTRLVALQSFVARNRNNIMVKDIALLERQCAAMEEYRLALGLRVKRMIKEVMGHGD